MPRNMTILNVLTSEEFLAPDPALQIQLQEKEEQFLFASTVDAAWAFDRPYLVQVNATMGCENDLRADTRYKICLPEFKDKSFWLYALGQGREGDFMRDDYAQINGPTNFHKFDTAGPENHNLDLTDVVRSSLFVHRNKLDDAINSRNVPIIQEAVGKEGVITTPNVNENRTYVELNKEIWERLGQVPGAFRIPVCVNPGGESLSRVWSDDGRNCKSTLRFLKTRVLTFFSRGRPLYVWRFHLASWLDKGER